MRLTSLAWTALLWNMGAAQGMSVPDIINKFTASDGSCGADIQVIMAAIGQVHPCVKGDVSKPDPPSLG